MSQGKNIIALDVGASGVKIARFTQLKDGSLELLAYALKDLGIDPHDDTNRTASTINAIMGAMADVGLTGGPVLLAVSGQSVFSRYVKLPLVAADKIDQIVRYEAQQNVPFPIEDVQWDYQLLDSSEDEQDVLLVAVKKDILEEVTSSVTEAGLLPDLIDVAPMAIYNAVRYNYGELDGCTLVLDIGARSTNLIFVEQGRIFSRSIPVAGNAITQQIMREYEMEFDEAEQLKKELGVVSLGGAYEPMEDETQENISKCIRSVMTRMHAEISRSLNFYRSQQGGNMPDRILLTGGTSIIPQLDVFLTDKLGVEVEFLNPFQTVVVSGKIQEDEIATHAHLLSEVIGLALRKTNDAVLQLDLLPSDILQIRKFKKKQPILLMALALFFLTSLAWAGYFYTATQSVNEELTEVKAHVATLESHKKNLASKTKQIEAVKENIGSLMKLREDRAKWLTVLEEIRQAVPEGAWVTDIQLEPVTAALPVSTVNQDSPRRKKGAKPIEEEQPVGAQGPVLNVQGLVYEDIYSKNNQMLTGLEARLRASPLFSADENDTKIFQTPPALSGDFKRSFWIKVKLQEPLPL